MMTWRGILHALGLVAGLAGVTGCALPTDGGPATAKAPEGEATILSPEAQAAFPEWLGKVREEALTRGIHSETIDAAFRNLDLVPRVIELDRRQPEFTQTLWGYFDNTLPEQRIERGREMLARHRPLLSRIEKRYGVPARVLVAFWGLETGFGANTGGFPLMGALATLAYEGRRGAFFRNQLLVALEVMDHGDIPPDAKSSWAGAMGQMQFMPTTWRDFAVDFDGDGRRDLWNSLPDIFASAGNYLSRSGWNPERTWGREVRLPPGFDAGVADGKTKKPLTTWRRLGVRQADGGDLPRKDIPASLLLPEGVKGPAFLVYDNFGAILDWNRSVLYALAIGHFSDRLAGGGPLVAGRPAGYRPLSRTDVTEMQTLLARLGHYEGEVDGVVGGRTRDAVKAFQRQSGAIADGHPDHEVLARLREAADAGSRNN